MGEVIEASRVLAACLPSPAQLGDCSRTADAEVLHGVGDGALAKGEGSLDALAGGQRPNVLGLFPPGFLRDS